MSMYSNPYDFQRPIRDPRLFAGRHDELEEVEYYFELAKSDNPRFFNLAIVGPRSSGKTSFLNMIQHITNKKGFLAVKLSLNNDLVESDVLLFKEIFDGVMTEGLERGLFGNKGRHIYQKFRKMVDTLAVNIQIPLLFGTAYIGTKKGGHKVTLSQHVLIHDLKKLYSEAKKLKIPGIVLLFDECDLLAKNETMLQKLRNAFQEVDGYVLILSGTEKMFPSISETFSPIPRFFKRIDVGNFRGLDETKDCILKPLNKDEAKIVDQSSIAEIHSFTAGSPYEINLVSHYMYKHYKKSGQKIIKLMVGVLDDVLGELERLRKGEHHKTATKIKSLWVPHLRALIALTELGHTHTHTLARYMLLDILRQLTPRKAKMEIEVNERNIEILEKEEIIKVGDKDRLGFAGDQFDLLYLKYSALTKGISKFFVGWGQNPIINIHFKLLKLLLEGIKEYEFQGRFDKSEIPFEEEHEGRLFVSGFHGKVSGKRTFTLVSPEIEKRFYLGSPKSIRFRVNVKYLNKGFVTQITFPKDADKNLFETTLTELSEKLEIAELEIVTEDEIYWNAEGAKLLRQKKFSESIDLFNKSIKINQNFELSWLNKSRALFNLGKHDQAMSCCDKALEIRPRISEAWNLKGRILFHKGEFATALPCFEKSAEFDPENWAAWDNIGRTLARLGRFDEAITFFDRVLRNNPKNIVVMELKATALARSGALEKAIECWDAILSLDSGNKMALGSKGHALLEVDKNEEALILFNELIEKDPKNVVALYNKACCLSKLERVSEAIDTLREASLMDSGVLESAKEDKDFDKIKSKRRFAKLIYGDNED